ncbi:MAG TPA: SLC13 family permease [Actinomycetota bacterium]
MPWEAWFTLAVTMGTVWALATEKLSPPHAMLAAVTVLLVAGVVEASEAFSGFSNAAPLTVAALYVLAGAVERTGVLEHLTARILGSEPQERRSELARVLLPTAASSAFLNNTPIVAMIAPAVAGWARRTGRSSSKFLMPISFAAILGGLLTVIGTSTNLVVSGLLDEAGREPIGLFEIAKVGAPIAVAGLVVLVLIAPRLLPQRRAPGEHLTAETREYTVEMTIGAGSPVAGRTVAEAGLRNLEGVYLIELERAGHTVVPVPPEHLLEAGDRLIFAGAVERIVDLQRMPGLAAAEDKHFDVAGDEGAGRFYEVVVSGGSPLAGSTLKDVGFRGRYGAAVFAAHRAGERIQGKLGEVPLRAGDVLLVLTDSRWGDRWRDHRDFLVVAALAGTPTLRADKARIVGLIAAGLLIAAGTGLLDILPAAMVAGLLLIGTKVLTRAEARDAIDLEVVVTIAASFGLGAAMSTSGLAERIGSLLVDGLGGLGDLGLLAGVLLASMILTEMITNNAAAVLVFPIAVATALQAGLDPRPFAIAVAVGASSSFLTPIGYQTNTMVYGMGGYRFGDFARVGAALTGVVFLVALAVIPVAFPLHP